MGALISLLATDPAPRPYLVGMLVGFGFGVFGHVIKAKALIAAGIIVIAVTTGLFIAATNPVLGG